MDLTLDNILTPSQEVDSRLFGDELILVPLLDGIGNLDAELYTMNETGKAIWSRLDGERPLRTIARELAEEFNTTLGVVEKDLLRLAKELQRRKMVVIQ